MATDWDRFVESELPQITQHFDNQLAALRSLVEAATAKQDANHMSLVAELARVARDVAEVRADVKTQNSRMSKAEQEIAYMKGQRSGGSAMYTAFLAAISSVAGAGSVILGLALMGR